MNITIILVVISSILTLVSVIPYLIDIVKGRTKPRVVSWFVWSLLTGISFVASFTEHQYPTAALMFCSVLATMAIVVLGWKNGDKKISRLDIFCFIGVVIGIIFWVIFNSPSIAVVAMIAIDFIGGIPTQVHAWKKPQEETMKTFVLGLIGSLLTLMTVTNWQITAFAYPLFLVIININFVLLISIRRLVFKKRNARTSVSLL